MSSNIGFTFITSAKQVDVVEDIVTKEYKIITLKL